MTTYNQPISKDQALPPGQDYARLRAEGLRHLQQLSGQVWTDYNDHDPGVTLLEALCYALTDVSYRAALPMQTLLAAPPPQAPANTLLVPPHQAFANHPVTLNDYKKLVLDQFHDRVKNAWLSPLPPVADGHPAPPGHYQVSLELYPQLPNAPDSLGEAVQEKLKIQVLQTLNRYRNLGETFGRATVLRPHPVAVGGHLVLATGQEPVAVLAHLLYALNQVLSPDLLMASASELLAEGWAPEDIFAGPRVKHRLLVESSFVDRLLSVELGQLLKCASKIAGIHYIHELHLYDIAPGTPGETVEQVAFGDDEMGALDPVSSLNQLAVSRQGIPLSFDHNRVVQAYYKLLRANSHELQVAARPDQLHLPAPTGTYADLGRYDSVQRLLPAFYGVGEDGPPPGATATARASIMQLKGYLLLFDQLLADFCAQLENVGAFLSPAPPATMYHTGLLYDAPYVAPLLPGTHISPDDAWTNAPGAAASWQAYQAQPANAYRRGLQKLADSTGDGLARRHDFLAHLLARFGYTVQLYRHSHTTALAEDQATVHAYEQLLSNLDLASYHRGAAQVHCAATAAQCTCAESGLEFFLFLLAGLESLPRKWAKEEHLDQIEAQVQLGNQPLLGQPKLVVHGSAIDFAQLLDVAAGQQRQPTALSSGRARLASPAGAWELELVNAPADSPAPSGHADRLLHYLTHLDRQAERVSLLDHLVLLPAPPAEAAQPDADAPATPDFFHCQATVLLPGYAYRFRPAPAAAGLTESRQLAGSRVFIEALVRQYAPAHLLVNVLWLDYPAMREWEKLYAALAAASPLLPGSQPDPHALAEAQHQAYHFLVHHLHPGH